MLSGSFKRLLASIQTVSGIGPATADKLRARGIVTLEDALFFLPRRYQDRRRVTPVAELEPGLEAVVRGRVVKVRSGGGRGKRLFNLTLADETGELTATWFRSNPGLSQAFSQGDEVVLAGRVGDYKGQPSLVHPEIIPADKALGDERFAPIYPALPGLSSKVFRRFVAAILDSESPRLASPLPPDLIAAEGLLDLAPAFRRVHFPLNDEDVDPGGPPRRTLVFTELFLYQACLAKLSHRRRSESAPPVTEFEAVRAEVTAALPFTLTEAQSRVLDELAGDLAPHRPPMHRLLQGDVGAGKTIVAAVPLLAAAKSGGQVAMMAPTEILARQHLQTLAPLAENLGLRAELITGSLNGADRKKRRADLAAGRVDVVIGTHALFQEATEFRDLSLIVIDEQHRFGVGQRTRLQTKADRPHRLVMTATPIPRSLALTLHGDLDMSILDQKPADRQPVVTRILPPSRIGRAWQAVRGAVDQGLQAYVVLPAIEPGSHLASAEERFADLTAGPLAGLRLGLLHGRLTGEEQQAAMADFASGRTDVLVATTMVEVGLDVARAAVMVIEQAERFGLAQLHQLRGRIGRGGSAAACLLISDAAGQGRERLELLEKTEDGFEIAEADLRFRGPGDLIGQRQTGWPDFRLANLLDDLKLLNRARQAARQLIAADPELERPEHALLGDLVAGRLLARLAGS